MLCTRVNFYSTLHYTISSYTIQSIIKLNLNETMHGNVKNHSFGGVQCYTTSVVGHVQTSHKLLHSLSQLNIIVRTLVARFICCGHWLSCMVLSTHQYRTWPKYLHILYNLICSFDIFCIMFRQTFVVIIGKGRMK